MPLTFSQWAHGPGRPVLDALVQWLSLDAGSDLIDGADWNHLMQALQQAYEAGVAEGQAQANQG